MPEIFGNSTQATAIAARIDYYADNFAIFPWQPKPLKRHLNHHV